MKNYQKAIRYATRLIRNYNAPYNPRDLVHDAYVQWYRYNTSNLFDQPERLIMRVVKTNHWNNIKRTYYQYEGQKFKRERIIIRDESDEENTLTKVHILKEITTPENILISKEYIENINKSLCIFDKRVLDLRCQGYNNKEIKIILTEGLGKGKNNQKLTAHHGKLAKSIKNIKEKMHTKSPFNGSKLTIIKKMKRKDFETDKENFLKDWEMGEGSDYNDSYVQMTSKTNPKEGLLIKEKDSD